MVFEKPFLNKGKGEGAMSETPRIVYVTVVRDFGFYDRFFINNPNVNGHTLCPVDNRADNLFITNRYNQFLETYDYDNDAWFVFCHEDFEMKEDIAPILAHLDPGVIYGPIGCRLKVVKKTLFGERVKTLYLGQVVCSNKDGTDPFVEGQALEAPERVDTVDCMCLIVHSSLVHGTGLRFDEKLSYDLYAEDFSIHALREFSVFTAAVQLKCQHWSKGNFCERFYRQLIYLNRKYKDASYAGTCAVIGKQPMPFKSWRRMTLNRLKLLFQKKK